ncbi:MAG: hypothetical protein AB8G95_15925 [Anaerolineae bacterium]
MNFSHFSHAPLIHADDDPRLEGNVNGPSLIRVPDWVEHKLGRYYLYFAHHEGQSIRLAVADELAGPWCLHWPGVLLLGESGFATEPTDPEKIHSEAAEFIAQGTDGVYPHIASPDVHIDEATKELRMYFHGRLADGRQRSRIAVSKDGLSWTVHEPLIGYSYFRVFQHAGAWFSLTMPGFFCRSADGLAPFDELGEIVFGNGMRHSALLKRGDLLYVFWTRIGDAPERILLSKIDLNGDWRSWSAGEPVAFKEIHRPTKSWEGVNLPAEPSKGGGIMRPVNQLRDPAIFEEDGQVYLLYSIQGEQGLAIGTLSNGQ